MLESIRENRESIEIMIHEEEIGYQFEYRIAVTSQFI